MKRTGLVWFGIVLAGIAVGAVVSIFQSRNYVGGPILAALFGAGALRAWYLAGAARSPRP